MPAPEPPSRVIRALALAVVPALTIAVAAWVAWSVRAHWVAAYFDPDYHYLLNSLMLAEGHAPKHIDHPGTPLQEFAGGVLLARHGLGLGPAGAGSVREGVLRDPESALTAISVCLRVLLAGAVFLLGVRARQLTGSLACAVATQGAAMLSMIGLLSVWRVSPEPLVMTISLLLGCVTLRLLATPEPRRKLAGVAGVIAGVGIATKVTFAPLALVPLGALSGRRRIGVYAAATAVALLGAISPILGESGRLFRWFGKMAVNDGVYGRTEGHFVINPSTYAAAFCRMIAEEPSAFVTAVLSLALLVHLWRSGLEPGAGTPRLTQSGSRWRALDERGRAVAGTLALVTGVELLQYVLVAKHAGDRYLVPALMLQGLNVSLGYIVLRDAYGPVVRKRVVAFAVLLLVGYAAVLGVRLERRLADQHAESLARMALHERALRIVREHGGVIACAYPSSSPVYSLTFADWWTGNRFGKDIREMYPGEWNYNVWGKTWSVGAARIPKTRAAEEAAKGTLWIQGVRDVLPAEFDYEEIARAGEEGLYRVISRAKPATP